MNQVVESHDPWRRRVLRAGLAMPLLSTVNARAQTTPPDPAVLLKAGGLVFAMRHAQAPGTFDPPNFKLGECSTQRLLSEEGRAQARRIGLWFSERKLKPSRVRTSPWCRCIDTANLAFSNAQVWPALGSPRGNTPLDHTQHLAQLRDALKTASSQSGRFEVWVTHMFVLTDLTQQNMASGEALLLRTDATAKGQVNVLARLLIE